MKHRKSWAITRMLATATACVLMGTITTACAATPPYNPDHLNTTQFDLVSDVCQDVMGLRPNEPMRNGDWLGEPRLDYTTSRYRVCIISLSDSLQSAVDAKVTHQADVDCRAQGLKSGSSELALCVLKEVNASASQNAATASNSSVNREALPKAASPYDGSSPHDYVHREELACAAIGLDPTNRAFETCVKDINHALYSIENPIS